MTASADLLVERAKVQGRLELNASQGAHSVLAALVVRQRRYLAALDADDYAAAQHELNCLRVIVSSDEPQVTDQAAPWLRSLRCLALVACAVLLVSAVVSAIGYRLRATDAEAQLEMCRRAR